MESDHVWVGVDQFVVQDLPLNILIHTTMLIYQLYGIYIAILSILCLVNNTKRPLPKLLYGLVPHPRAGKNIVTAHIPAK